MALLNNIERAGKFRIQPYRKLIQLGFLLVTLWIGFEFILFVRQLENGTDPVITRPPGVEAFLPISALISLKYWVLTGVFSKVHPAALVILLLAMTTGILLKKGFCSWVCPVGLLSEHLSGLHSLLFSRRLSLPRWLDYSLRSIKYLLLFFFLWSIFVVMDTVQLEKFIFSPYNRVADIKMLKFFAEMSATTFWTLLILLALSVIVPYFWCRYLCPYGALLGGISWLSFLKIHRNEHSCIDCEMCSMACPASIEVHTRKKVISDECHACMQCVDMCPVKNTLYLSIGSSHARIPRFVYAMMVVFLFTFGAFAARSLGVWHNNISPEEYRYHITHLDEPAYNHNRGQVSDYEPATTTMKSR